MIPNTALAPSAPPVNVKPTLNANHSVNCSSKATLTIASATAVPAMIAGRNQKLERMRFQYLKICTLTMTAPGSIALQLRPNLFHSGRGCGGRELRIVVPSRALRRPRN